MPRHDINESILGRESTLENISKGDFFNATSTTTTTKRYKKYIWGVWLSTNVISFMLGYFTRKSTEDCQDGSL